MTLNAGTGAGWWLRQHGGRVLHHRPLIVTSTTVLHELPIGLAPILSPMIGARPAVYLLRLFWQVETPAKVAEFVEAHRRHAQAYPDHRVVVLANSPREAWRLQQAGIPVFLCSQNAFVDERAFDVLPDVEKTFDAVYTARFQPYKRHELAAAVRSLVLVYSAVAAEDRQHFDEVRRLLPQATFANREESMPAIAAIASTRARLAAKVMLDDGFAAPLSAARVAHWLNRARVGLCLSRREGAMFASVEYLLCGLPVVSTESLGGRDRYFDPDHTRIVEDDPTAIAAAVATLVAARLDPLAIRAKTLAMIGLDRRAFVDLVQDLIDAAGGGTHFADRFPTVLAEGLFPLSRIADIAAEALQ